MVVRRWFLANLCLIECMGDPGFSVFDGQEGAVRWYGETSGGLVDPDSGYQGPSKAGQQSPERLPAPRKTCRFAVSSNVSNVPPAQDSSKGILKPRAVRAREISTQILILPLHRALCFPS